MKSKAIVLTVLLAVMLLSFLYSGDTVKVDVDRAFAGISLEFPLGTDNLGRDLFALLAKGGIRTCVVIAVAVFISFLAGNALGVTAGYYEKTLGSFIQLLSDITLVLPTFITALIVCAVFGMNPLAAGIVFGIGNMGEYINQSKALTKDIKKQSYIDAERVLGLTELQIIVRHIIPNIIRPLFTFMGNKASAVSIQYASLTFIGIGADISNPDWGTMLYQYRMYILYYPRLIIFPSIAVFCIALFFHYMFDDVRDNDDRGMSVYD